MTGEPLETGSEGLHPGDEGKTYETRGKKASSVEDRKLQRQALLDSVAEGADSKLSESDLEERSMKRRAYWLGGGGLNEPTPGKEKYPKEEADKKIAEGVKDTSLFYGTLGTLMAATEVSGILDGVRNGFRIVFEVPRVFFFRLDREEKILSGTCHDQDRHYPIVRSIAIPRGLFVLLGRPVAGDVVLSAISMAPVGSLLLL